MPNNKERYPDAKAPVKRKEREDEIQVKKMTRYPPSLNGINKNLP
ncbi:hypothetical protein ACF3MZ_08075 [Paenibacillaceae bacterium WGS1546]